MISTKERAKLRGLANNLEDIVFIGKEGITANVLKQIAVNLLAHELIKIKVQSNANLTARQACDLILETIDAQPISVVGNKIILYQKRKSGAAVYF